MKRCGRRAFSACNIASTSPFRASIRRSRSCRPIEQPAAFIAFDLLRDGDDDLRNLPLDRAAQASRGAVQEAQAARLRARPADAAVGRRRHALMKQAHEENWEGLMVKLARSPYRTAKRSPEWMKYKLNKQDEFVVVRLDRSRRHARALRIADPRRARQGRLRYAGEVGTGFNAAELERVMKMLKRLETPTCPLNPKPKILSAKGTPHWVRPQLVAQVRYTRDHRRRPASPSGLPRVFATTRRPRKSRFQRFQRFQGFQGSRFQRCRSVPRCRKSRKRHRRDRRAARTSSRRRARTAGSSCPTATRSRSRIFTRSSGRRSRRPRAI